MRMVAEVSPTIALVDDDRNILTSVSLALQAEGFATRIYVDGAAGLKGVLENPPDLAVVDIKMPRMDGMEMLRRLREKSDVPVIFLTSKDTEIDEALGLAMGADDYIGKPFSPRELIARMKALLKRAGATQTASAAFILGGLRVDATARTAQIDGETIALSPKEFDLLAFFVSRPEVAFTRDQLLNHVWGYDFFGDARTVDTHVKSLREKLGAYRDRIVTVWGTGYRFSGGSV